MEIPRELPSEFTRTLSRQPSEELPQRLCRAFAEVVGADGAAISVGTTSTRRLVAATDRRTEQIEDLQALVGKGAQHPGAAWRRPLRNRRPTRRRGGLVKACIDVISSGESSRRQAPTS